MAHRILIVDDEKPILELLKIKLMKRGFEVITASTVEEGMRQAFTGKPDLLILDIWLNGGKIGTDVYAEMVEAGFDGKVPVIFISALVDAGHPPTRSPQGGKYALFGKPFDFELLLAEINKLLARSAGAAAGKKTDPAAPE